MERRALGSSGLKIPFLGLGAMNFGSDWLKTGVVDEATARDLADLCLERGANLIDTANVYGYGASEAMIGRIVKGRRSRFILTSKVRGPMVPGDSTSGGLSRVQIAEALEATLRRLETDYLDIYMPHAPDPGTELEESLEAFSRAVSSGKIRVLGCSNFEPEYWERALSWAESAGKPRFEFNQIQVSLANAAELRRCSGVVSRRGVSLWAWSPLGGGLLSGKYAIRGARPEGRRRIPGAAFPRLSEPRTAGLVELLKKTAELEGLSTAQVAIGWLLAKKELAGVLLGARNRAQLEETLSARLLSGPSQQRLDAAMHALESA